MWLSLLWALVVTSPPESLRVRILAPTEPGTALQAAKELRATLAADARLIVAAEVVLAASETSTTEQSSAALSWDRLNASLDEARQSYVRLEPARTLEKLAALETELLPHLQRSEVVALLARALRLRGQVQLFQVMPAQAAASFVSASFLDPDFSPAAEEWPPESRLAYADALAAIRRHPGSALSVRVVPEQTALWLDGRSHSMGPTTMTDLRPGGHYLLGVCPGHKSLAAVVNVEAGGKLNEAMIVLEALPGTSSGDRVAAAVGAALDQPWEGVVTRQVNALMLADVLLWVGTKTSKQQTAEAPNHVWIWNREGKRLGQPLLTHPVATTAAEIQHRIWAPTELKPVAEPTPWYQRWYLWGAGAGVLLVGGTLGYVLVTYDRDERVSFGLGPKP